MSHTEQDALEPWEQTKDGEFRKEWRRGDKKIKADYIESELGDYWVVSGMEPLDGGYQFISNEYQKNDLQNEQDSYLYAQRIAGRMNREFFEEN